MSSKHGGGVDSGASPAEPAVAEPDPATPSSDAGHDREGAGGADPDEGIRAAGGTVVGESDIAGLADRSQVRRAPRYKRFVVFGGLMGVLLAAVATPFADFEQTLSPWGLFLLLVTILVPFLILVSCAVAVLTDRAARVPPRKRRNRKGRR